MNIKVIIEKYKNEFGIITDIDAIIDELDKLYSKEELSVILKEILIYNNKKYDEINKSLRQKKIIQSNTYFYSKKDSILKEEKDNKPNMSGIDIDVSNYLDKIIKFNDDTDILNIINKISNKNILLVLKCRILEYITYYKKEIINNNSSDEVEFCNNEINRLSNALNYIINFESIINPNNQLKPKNKLLFLSDNNNILFLKDLEDIDRSEYISFYSLLSSLVIGTFNGNKSVNMPNGNKIPELRRINGQRIIYDKICNDYYIVLFAFDKNNNFIYKSTLVERYNTYIKKKNDIQKLILCNDQQFLREQFDIQEKILSLLHSKKGRGLNG